MHNFENQIELEMSGKRFPTRGKLRSLKNRIGYISDDYTWVSVEFREESINKQMIMSRV